MSEPSAPPDKTPERRFPCSSCGAGLVFKPDTSQLECPYCGARNEIASPQGAVQELDYRAFLERAAAEQGMDEVQQIACSACGARTTLPGKLAAASCPFCGSNMVLASAANRQIKPGSLLPFKLDQRAAFDRFRGWIRKRWFAPGGLKQYARSEQKLAGVYLPWWTYDSRAVSRYSGERGDHYYETEWYTVIEQGKSVRRTRQVRRTRWTHASGTVEDTFDDLLVAASESLPRKYAAQLEPWDLENLVPYTDDYLSGFRAECYQVGLPEGFEQARALMEPAIRQSVCRDIGGDEQRIHSLATDYGDITFKHILLPVWLSAYRFRDKVYRIMVNARTGEVQGERPWSAWKIAAAVLAGLITVALIFALASLRQ